MESQILNEVTGFMIPVRIQGLPGQGDEAEAVQHIQRSYALALDRFTHVIREVEIWVSDVNGPRGGIDKSCRVQLRLYPRGLLVAKSSGSTFLQAAKAACDTAKDMLARKLSRANTKRGMRSRRRRGEMEANQP